MTLTHSDASELVQLMEGTTAGALIPEIVRRGFQELLEPGVSALTGAQLHGRCPDQRSTHRDGYRRRLLTTQVGDLTLAIPKLRHGSFSPDWLAGAPPLGRQGALRCGDGGQHRRHLHPQRG